MHFKGIALAAFVISVSGCTVTFPVPRQGLQVTADWRKSAAVMMSTGTTREEVIRGRGVPMWDFRDLGVMGYEWGGEEWGEVTAGFDQFDGGWKDSHSPPVERHRLLWMAFDAQDRLVRWKLTRPSEFQTPCEQAARWRASLKLPPVPSPSKHFTPVQPEPGKATVHLMWAKGRVADRVQFVRLDGCEQAGIKQGRFTTLTVDAGHHEIKVFVVPLRLDLAAGEVCFLEFRPDLDWASEGQTLFKCPEAEACAKLQRLTYCR